MQIYYQVKKHSACHFLVKLFARNLFLYKALLYVQTQENQRGCLQSSGKGCRSEASIGAFNTLCNRTMRLAFSQNRRICPLAYIFL